MRNIKAIFNKQIKDLMKNTSVLMMFIVFPVVALVFSHITGDTEGTEGIPIMMASMFAGMGIIMSVALIIAEDRENKSLRFLIMAGVKPISYLLGVDGVILILGLLSSLTFGFIGGFKGQEFWIFLAAMMTAVSASTLLGAIIGISSKNQQAANGLAMPVGMVLGFAPMLAQFNDTVARATHIFYTQQLNVVTDSFTSLGDGRSLWQSFSIMWGNVAVFVVVFAFVFKKKGLRGE
ncbi:MAG: ABC transporter permease [Defluviitaleaceae bacterium]|nr:ABC transporter permease [Defluviitaleaceae bacterium]